MWWRYGAMGLWLLFMAEVDRAEGSRWYRLKAWFWTGGGIVFLAAAVYAAKLGPQ